MTATSELSKRHCTPCEGEVPPLSAQRVHELLAAMPAWTLTTNGKRMRREWRMKDFAAALAFFNAIGVIAESENHHPDLHVTNYRDAAVELWTHAIDGLSENDFILAAKIDMVPVQLKK
jgi:4a-hydroxytetrahydrobiopterin dehydratase